MVLTCALCRIQVDVATICGPNPGGGVKAQAGGSAGESGPAVEMSPDRLGCRVTFFIQMSTFLHKTFFSYSFLLMYLGPNLEKA